VRFLGRELASPLVLASGILGLSSASLIRVAEAGAGLVTTKSLSLEPRRGHLSPITAEFSGGIINSVGLANPGISAGLEEVERFKERSETPICVSIFGAREAEFARLAHLVDGSSADFLELNLSCPNVEDEFQRPFALDPDRTAHIVELVKAEFQRPVLVKLSPNAQNIGETASAAREAGADALTVINTLGPGLLIDPHSRRPVLHHNVGGISGPCLKPLTLRLVSELHQQVDLPLIGTGGVLTGTDAAEMLIAGAQLVGIGTAFYYRGPEALGLIKKELDEFLAREGVKDYADLIGTLEWNS